MENVGRENAQHTVAMTRNWTITAMVSMVFTGGLTLGAAAFAIQMALHGFMLGPIYLTGCCVLFGCFARRPIGDFVTALDAYEHARRTLASME